LRDVLWLQVDEQLEKQIELEFTKSRLEIERERVKALFIIISDIRHIQLSKMYFKTDAAFKDFLTTLPSYQGDAQKEKQERRWKVKKRKPGEIPAWKKKRLAEQSVQDVK